MDNNSKSELEAAEADADDEDDGSGKFCSAISSKFRSAISYSQNFLSDTGSEDVDVAEWLNWMNNHHVGNASDDEGNFYFDLPENILYSGSN